MTLLLPDWSSRQAGAALLSAGALVAMLRFKLGLLPTLGRLRYWVWPWTF